MNDQFLLQEQLIAPKIFIHSWSHLAHPIKSVSVTLRNALKDTETNFNKPRAPAPQLKNCVTALGKSEHLYVL